ncbi:hypothetical protein DID88_002750 [Monilinia fructigena]|uniref:Alpha/beta hydrolase fold-3 domain-containing protein n=1 Tax=Monilinia fructigena TaxID=38457 RepID=A0A395IN07_9HELO|nr:hypothetical protein DID88_002750 [Monilinia fructigena]
MTTSSSEGYKPEWLEIEKALGTRPLLTGSIAEIKQQFNAMFTTIAAQVGPLDSSVQARATHPQMASQLGPKHKLPVMLDDSVKAYKWAWQHVSEIGADNAHVFTIGTSAGAGLALTVANDLIAAGKRDLVQGIVALVPITAHPLSVPAAYKEHYKSYDENASGVPIIDRATMDTFLAAVDTDFNDPRTFVTLSPHLDKFPPTYISTCGKDVLRDDGKVLELMLEEKGVKTKRNLYDELPHWFWAFPGLKYTEEFLANTCEGVKFVLGL